VTLNKPLNMVNCEIITSTLSTEFMAVSNRMWPSENNIYSGIIACCIKATYGRCCSHVNPASINKNFSVDKETN